jgi:hypothetical protein
MAIQHSDAVRNAVVQAVETTIGTTPKLRIYQGAKPATCSAAAAGTLLIELVLPSDWMAAPAAGTALLLGSWTGTITTSGTASYYRIYDSAGATCHEQGSVGRYSAIALTASTPANNAVLTMASTATLSVGLQVSGPGISASTYVQQITDATHATMTKVSIPGMANGSTVYFTTANGADLGLPSLTFIAGQPLTIDFRNLTAAGA